jgi:glutamate dehydrogenase/leucine dehydrogenase
VLTANRLRDGAVVYLAADGTWSERIDAAAPAQDEALKALHDIAAQALAANIVVDVAAINVDLSLRERIRRTGPTVRPDLARA